MEWRDELPVDLPGEPTAVEDELGWDAPRTGVAKSWREQRGARPAGDEPPANQWARIDFVSP